MSIDIHEEEPDTPDDPVAPELAKADQVPGGDDLSSDVVTEVTFNDQPSEGEQKP